MTSSLKEHLARREPIPAADRVSSGSPGRYLIEYDPKRNGKAVYTVVAAKALTRRHVTLRRAHAAVTEVVATGRAIVEVPCVEDRETFERELRDCRLIVTRYEAPTEIDVAAIRERTGLSQDQFALRFGLDAATVRNWEQGRSSPDKAARVLLLTIDKDPTAVEKALSTAA
ncbi:MAG: helix-turn-helix domain-containing protein [Reyranellaceae bacterium]